MLFTHGPCCQACSWPHRALALGCSISSNSTRVDGCRKGTIIPAVGWGEESLLWDPGSELTTINRRKRWKKDRSNKWDGRKKLVAVAPHLLSLFSSRNSGLDPFSILRRPRPLSLNYAIRSLLSILHPILYFSLVCCMLSVVWSPCPLPPVLYPLVSVMCFLYFLLPPSLPSSLYLILHLLSLFPLPSLLRPHSSSLSPLPYPLSPLPSLYLAPLSLVRYHFVSRHVLFLVPPLFFLLHSLLISPFMYMFSSLLFYAPPSPSFSIVSPLSSVLSPLSSYPLCLISPVL